MPLLLLPACGLVNRLAWAMQLRKYETLWPCDYELQVNESMKQDTQRTMPRTAAAAWLRERRRHPHTPCRSVYTPPASTGACKSVAAHGTSP